MIKYWSEKNNNGYLREFSFDEKKIVLKLFVINLITTIIAINI